jgi:hypothetical protein
MDDDEKDNAYHPGQLAYSYETPKVDTGLTLKTTHWFLQERCKKGRKKLM